jgi:AAT family amino acid transporter/GABA permease
MMVTPEHRTEVSSTIGLALVISFIGLVTTRHHGQRQRTGSAQRA